MFVSYVWHETQEVHRIFLPTFLIVGNTRLRLMKITARKIKKEFHLGWLSLSIQINPMPNSSSTVYVNMSSFNLLRKKLNLNLFSVEKHILTSF